MEKIKYDYDPEENYDYNSEEGNYEQEENEALKKSLRGYRVIIIVLTIVLAGTSVFCFSLYRNERKTSKKLQNEKAISEENYKMSEVLRGALTDELDDLKVGYDTLRMKNDTLNVQFENAQKMIDQLKNERRLNYNALAKYKKEIESMRGVMKSYLKQIDSLNKQVKVVSAENINLKKKITSETLRAEKAEEQAKEAKNLIKQGSVLRARDISLVALNAKDNEVSRIKNAKKLRVDFVVGANDLAAAGHRNVYLCLISPDGYTISTEATPEFDYQGSKKIYSASREIDYQNEDISVSIFYGGSGFTPGTYKAELYMDDTLIGSAEIFMK